MFYPPQASATISIALCTCNGERFLKEQLDSILGQTRLPDEVIASDDASTDGTLALLEAFRTAAPFPVHILRNDVRLGSTRNFDQALRRCTGDLIALSDQDDRWNADRLRQSATVLLDHPQAVMVFTDGKLIDERGQALSGSVWQSFGFAGERQQQFRAGDYSLLCRERFMTGATMMLRRSNLAGALPIPDVWIHDAWLGCVLSFAGEILPLEVPLIDYRVHAQQQVGTGVSLWRQRATHQASAHWERVHGERRQLETLLDFLIEHPPRTRAGLLVHYQRRTDFLRMRDALPRARFARLAPILRHWSQYSQQAAGWPSRLKDLLFARDQS